MREYLKKVCDWNPAEFHERLRMAVLSEEKMFIVTANPETLMIGMENEEFDRVLKDPKTTIVADGIGVVKAANLLGKTLKERITGIGICEYLLALGDREKKSIYLYGAKEEVLDSLVKKIHHVYPGIEVVGQRNGYEGSGEEVFHDMMDKKPDIVLVALGIPRQELIISQFYHKFEKGIFVGVGGSFDILSGMKNRAPGIFIRLNLEWLYRIAMEPKRFARFYRSNVRFIGMINKLRVVNDDEN